MLARINSAATLGLDARVLDVEVDASGGVPRFTIVGLPDAGVREARERVRSALKNCRLRTSGRRRHRQPRSGRLPQVAAPRSTFPSRSGSLRLQGLAPSSDTRRRLRRRARPRRRSAPGPRRALPRPGGARRRVRRDRAPGGERRRRPPRSAESASSPSRTSRPRSSTSRARSPIAPACAPAAGARPGRPARISRRSGDRPSRAAPRRSPPPAATTSS